MQKIAFLLLPALFCTAGLAAQPAFQEIPGLPFLLSEGYLRGLTWVDVDGDNDLDISISGASGSFPIFVNATAVYVQESPGVFTNTGLINSSQLNPFGQGWADYDNDGDLDVYIAATWNNAGINELWRNEGAAAFTQITNSGATPAAAQPYEGTVSWGDYDNDGFADLFLVRWNNLANLLYRNNGDGTFGPSTLTGLTDDLTWTSGAYWADFDNDRDLDIYIVNYQTGTTDPGVNDLFRNNGNGTFTKLTTAGPVVTQAQNSRSANWVDADNDGLPDLFVGNQFGQDYLHFSNGNGTFTAQPIGNAGYTTWSSNWGDIDNDGDQDLFTMGFWGYESRCWRNDGNGVFTDITASFPNIYPLQTSGSSSQAVVLVDYDRDGWLDLHIAQPDAIDDHLYRNLGEGCRSWLEVECIGVQSNRAAIGTTIRAKATINGAPMWQMRQVLAQTAACGQNPLWQHFGFGDAVLIDSLVVEWPSGATCVFEKVAVNQLVEIEETCSLETVLSTPLGFAGEDANLNWCEDSGSLDLPGYLGGNPDPGGQWVDENFQPVEMPVQGGGLWYYLIDEPCPDTAQVIVIARPRPEVTLFPGDTTLEAGQTLQLLAAGGDSYAWYPDEYLSCGDCPDPVFTASQSVDLIVVGDNEYGCWDTARIAIQVISPELRFELPSAFSPDGDGVNDTFRPLTTNPVFQNFEMRIYNRWGQLVFSTKDPSAGWDGESEGNEHPSDVYAFYLEYTLKDGTTGQQKGEVTLLR